MNNGALALLIPILAIVGGYVVAIMKIREKQRLASREQALDNQALRTELETLRRRVEVLEQLVTDDGFQLKREFNKV
ncbi:hypothetical protein L2744_11920 [Shewanella profunda]|uniref:hypothetical protein n=1 Tax=Shewanella profunda TaxID=254793 RepID=UPI00200E7172|nr:hypothetical protein [Shewanella profunda]MCL1090285.1 hypothetical protein [Shewanella profunda]